MENLCLAPAPVTATAGLASSLCRRWPLFLSPPSALLRLRPHLLPPLPASLPPSVAGLASSLRRRPRLLPPSPASPPPSVVGLAFSLRRRPRLLPPLPLPLYLTNTIFFTLFFSVAYFLLHRWRDKIRTSTPLHVVTLSEIAAIFSLIASFIYLIGFFGIDFVQSFIARASHEGWELDEADQNFLLEEDSRRAAICTAAPKLSDP